MALEAAAALQEKATAEKDAMDAKQARGPDCPLADAARTMVARARWHAWLPRAGLASSVLLAWGRGRQGGMCSCPRGVLRCC